ncbi:hypothetical protein FZW96_07660 [Bacillus sp. BGMRC 2118]|nr:hypothetical protein FZW96_07660 [Bacillus sp. BGMRC 2118]
MKKLFVLMFSSLLFFVVGSVSVQASTDVPDLTEEERTVLLNEVGLSVEDLEILPVEHLRNLIEENAEVVLDDYKIVEIFEPIKTKPGQISTNGTISATKLKLTGKAVRLANNSAGQERFQLYGTWEWLSSPVNAYEDGFSVGFESGLGIKIPTSGGNVSEHSHEYATYERGIKNRREYHVYPESYGPGSGVGAVYDIRQGGVGHRGYLSQNVYMTTSSGTSNIKFEYGHAKTIVTPSFTVGTSGIFGINPGISVDTRYWAGELKW